MGNKTVARSFPDIRFTVYGCVSDTTGPVIESLTTDKTEATIGDSVTFTLKASDESGIKDNNYTPYVYLKYPNGNSEAVYLYKDSEGSYSGSYNVTKDSFNGEYTVGHVSVEDLLGNKTTANDFPSIVFYVISQDDYAVFSDISLLENIIVIASNRTLTDLTINGDVYIAPNAVVTMRNVTVKGNIYILGTLRAYSISAYNLRMKRLVMGTTAYGNGAVSLSGTCNLDSFTASNQVIDWIPLRFDKGVIDADGKLFAKGAFVNVAKMYINDVEVNSIANGKFYLNDIDVSKEDTINVKFVSVDGDMWSGTLNVIRGEKDDEGNTEVCLIGYRISYKWSEDNTSVTATAVPYIYGEDTITETSVASITELAPTMYESGSITYVAEFANALFETQERVVEVSRLPKEGWLKENGKWYFYKDDAAQTGWLKIDGKWYYFDASGVMQKGWQKIGGKWYYLNPGGDMVTGWKKISGEWYYFNSGGVMQTGWQEIGGKTYYLKPSGAMAANEWCKGWWLNKNGTWTYPYKASWKKDSKGWYYQDTSGWYAKNTTQIIDDKSYTFDSKGYWVQK